MKKKKTILSLLFLAVLMGATYFVLEKCGKRCIRDSVEGERCGGIGEEPFLSSGRGPCISVSGAAAVSGTVRTVCLLYTSRCV